MVILTFDNKYRSYYQYINTLLDTDLAGRPYSSHRQILWASRQSCKNAIAIVMWAQTAWFCCKSLFPHFLKRL